MSKATSETLARQKEYYKQNKDYILARNRIYEQKNKEKLAGPRRSDRFKRLYGITLEDYLKQLEFQHDVCSICKKPETRQQIKGTIRSLSVDHDHENGQARGLLCYNCNTALSMIKDDWRIAANLMLYLQFHSPTKTTGIRPGETYQSFKRVGVEVIDDISTYFIP